MLVLCALWGFQQVAIKLAAADVSLVMQGAIRSAIATALVLVWARAKGIALFERDGTLAPGLTCGDWTSDSASTIGQVGHSDGMGPGQSTAGALSSWNASHTNQNCSNTAPRGGAGRFYCFAAD